MPHEFAPTRALDTPGIIPYIFQEKSGIMAQAPQEIYRTEPDI
jgi:hypothetical protein